MGELFFIIMIPLEAVGAVEGDPLPCDGIEADVGVGVVPGADAEVYDEEAEVGRKGRREVVPFAGEVLEPDFRCAVVFAAVHERDLWTHFEKSKKSVAIQTKKSIA